MARLKSKAKKWIEEENIRSVVDLRLRYYSEGDGNAFVTHQNHLESYFRYTVACVESERRKTYIKHFPFSTGMYWYEWVITQDRPYDLLIEMAKHTKPRTHRNTKKSMVLVGEPNIGKTLACERLEWGNRVGHVNMSAKGVGKMSPCLDYPVVLFDEAAKTWLKGKRTMMLQLMGGTATTIDDLHGATILLVNPPRAWSNHTIS